jgi:hypothetical protein
MEQIQKNAKRIMLAGIVILLIILAADFNNRMSNLYTQREQRERVAVQATQVMSTQAALESQLAYATSQAAVEEWAYEDGKLARPGDVVVVPLSNVGPAPTPTPEPAPAPEPLTRWQIWMSLFFDSEK